MDNKTWRDAKIPKWVSESMEAELAAHKLTAALSWPNEPRPEPVPFRWVDYDRLIGKPIPGVYYVARHGAFRVEIREKQDGDSGWKSWRFKTERGNDFSELIQRGPLFESERDARLHLLWDACEKSASELMTIRAKIYG